MNNFATNRKSIKYSLPKKQRGVILIMSLVILMVLSLLGVSSMRTSSLQERMSGNARDYQIAFEAAEIALRSGEDYLKDISLNADFSAAGNNGKFTARTLSDSDAWRTEANWTSGKTTSVTIADVAKNPEYMIEIVDSEYGVIEDLEATEEGGGTGTLEISLYRITSRGYGKNSNTRVMLQTDFGKIK